jgi:predicted dehydrogenase
MLHASTMTAVGELSGKVQGLEGTIVYTGGFGKGEIRHARRDGEIRTLPIEQIQVEQPVRKELRLFVEAVRSGGPPPVPGTEGRRNVRIAEAAYESARTGRPVSL